jgi:hypothetical protein
MAVDIKTLMLDSKDEGSNEYKAGWNDAICYVLDTHKVETRNGEPIGISFEVKLDEDAIIKKVMKKK